MDLKKREKITKIEKNMQAISLLQSMRQPCSMVVLDDMVGVHFGKAIKNFLKI